jgi:branched-chain amino acid transport system substrate-binding protein
MKRRNLLNGLGALALAIGSIGTAQAADPVRIGIALPLSGAAATYGHESKAGADFAAERINAEGGILGGRKIELVYEDDKGTPQGGVAAVQKLISMGRARAISGGMNSSVVLAESSITRNKILQVNMAAQADAITDQGSPWLFQINNTVSMNSKAFNRYVTEKLAPKTVAYMGDNSEFSRTVLELLKESLAEAKIELVSVSTYDADTNDFTSMITKIKSLRPDLLYVSDAYPSRAAQLWKQVRQLGGFPKHAMSPGVVSTGMLKPSEGAMDGVVTGDIFHASVATGDMKAFVDEIRKRLAIESPSKGPLVAYEAVRVIAGAMDKAGTDSDYARIARTIRENSWPTPRGSLKFDDKGRATAPYFYVQQVKDGELALIDQVENH